MIGANRITRHRACSMLLNKHEGLAALASDAECCFGGDTMVAQTARQAPTATKSETFIAPVVLPVCCVCELIRDETRSVPDRERWVTPRTYQKAHGVALASFPITHTYCPKCFAKFLGILKQHNREIGTSPGGTGGCPYSGARRTNHSQM